MPADAHPETPDIVAHRGWAACYPENSLAALEAAVWLGLRHLEFDVQLTADGVPVLFHDLDLKRITGREGRVVDIPWAELARTPSGEPERLATRFGDVRPARLQDASRLLTRHPGITAFVEIKPESLAHFGMDAVWQSCAPIIRQMPRPVVTSFDRDLLERVRHSHRIAWVLPEYTEATLEAARLLAPQYLFCNRRRLPPGPAKLPAGPWEWAIYEIRSPAEARDLALRGVGLVETMDPAALRPRDSQPPS
jgi:glycerophosphoryl diester phosphodiesterase